jgi:hypothetical protein
MMLTRTLQRSLLICAAILLLGGISEASDATVPLGFSSWTRATATSKDEIIRGIVQAITVAWYSGFAVAQVEAEKRLLAPRKTDAGALVNEIRDIPPREVPLFHKRSLTSYRIAIDRIYSDRRNRSLTVVNVLMCLADKPSNECKGVLHGAAL